MTFEGARRLWRELTGRSNGDFVDALAAQLEACRSGAMLAHQLSRGQIASDEARRRMVVIEHRGDAVRATLVSALASALVTPIDREDLFRVSRSIDDVLDNLRDYVTEVDLLGSPLHPDAFIEITASIIEAIERLGVAVGDLADDPARVSGASILAKKSGNDIRSRYEAALAELFADPEAGSEESIRSVLRSRELLRRLDVVGLRLGEAADAISDAMLKRRY